MPFSSQPSQQEPRFREFDGDTYGEAHGFDDPTGDFKRDARERVRVLDGPPMVAFQLVRTLRTPIGDDPLRPEFGLDKRKLLGESQARTKEAIIEAIGPGADPRVARLSPPDIELDIGGNRLAEITVRAVLADGTPVEFSADFQALLGSENFDRTS